MWSYCSPVAVNPGADGILRSLEESSDKRKLERNGQFSLFDDLIHYVEMGPAKADLSIDRLYASLVADESLRERVFGMVVEEFATGPG